MNKRILQILIFISILFLISACDCPPLENDYTWADVPVPEKKAEESYKALLEIATINFDQSLTNFSTTLIYPNPKKYENEIETAWKNSSELHKLFDKLDSYEEIAILYNTNDNINIFKPLKSAIVLYTSYSRLNIAREDFDEAIIPLLKINSITRKTFPYVHGVLPKLVFIFIGKLNLDTCLSIISNKNCSTETIRKLKKPFLPFTNKEIAFKNLVISDYLYLQTILFDGQNAAVPTHKTTRFFKFLVKKNKTLNSIKKNINILLTCLTNSPPNFTKYCNWAENYKKFPDYFNYIGWSLSRMSIATAEISIKQILKVQTKSDLLAIKIHERCGETFDLNDPFTGKKYLRNPETGNYSSAGPDGIYKTKDDIFL